MISRRWSPYLLPLSDQTEIFRISECNMHALIMSRVFPMTSSVLFPDSGGLIWCESGLKIEGNRSWIKWLIWWSWSCIAWSLPISIEFNSRTNFVWLFMVSVSFALYQTIGLIRTLIKYGPVSESVTVWISVLVLGLIELFEFGAMYLLNITSYRWHWVAIINLFGSHWRSYSVLHRISVLAIRSSLIWVCGMWANQIGCLHSSRSSDSSHSQPFCWMYGCFHYLYITPFIFCNIHWPNVTPFPWDQMGS